jgi:hypothetical protein
MKANCAVRSCKNKAVFRTPLGKAFCSTECCTSFAANIVKNEKQVKKKAEDKVWREKKRKLNDTVPVWTKKAQAAFNAYIRARDRNLCCISCGSSSPNHSDSGGLWDCGHYRSVGSCPELRFEPLNAHKQCKKCNQFLSGNVVDYRIRLKDKIGDKKLEWLEGGHEPKRYRVDDLKAIEAKYKSMLKELNDV